MSPFFLGRRRYLVLACTSRLAWEMYRFTLSSLSEESNSSFLRGLGLFRPEFQKDRPRDYLILGAVLKQIQPHHPTNEYFL